MSFLFPDQEHPSELLEVLNLICLFLSFFAELLLIQWQRFHTAFKNNYACQYSCIFEGAGNLSNRINQ